MFKRIKLLNYHQFQTSYFHLKSVPLFMNSTAETLFGELVQNTKGFADNANVSSAEKNLESVNFL